MRAYLITTCLVFSLITVAHIWRIVAGADPQMAKNSWFILITLMTAALALWAAVLLKRSSPP